MVTIRPFRSADRHQVVALIDSIFPSQSLSERLSMRLFQTPLQGLLRLGGIREPRFWVAEENDTILGTVGLYETGDGLPWLGWFCTAPRARGRGIGSRLLDHAVETARSEGKAALRLYTSSDPNETSAQKLYEKSGFRIFRKTRPLLWRLAGSDISLIYRERLLN